MSYTQDPVINRVITQMIRRSDAGMVKYGQSLEHNHSKTIIEWIDDVIEELTDAAAYLEKLKTVLVVTIEDNNG